MKIKNIFVGFIIIIIFIVICFYCFLKMYPRQHISRQTAIKYFRYIKESNNLTIPKEGVIPDKETAIKIASILLSKKYGQRTIKCQMPLDVHLIDGYWHVRGTLPKGITGGTALIIISKKDGHVIHLAHSL